MILVRGRDKKGVIYITSILNTIKKLLGIDPDDDSFDVDIMTHINTSIFVLSQMGVGPKGGYMITSKDDEWDSYIPGSIYLQSVKTFIYLKTKILFDPPSNSATLESFNRQLSEIEWRLMLSVETGNLGG